MGQRPKSEKAYTAAYAINMLLITDSVIFALKSLTRFYFVHVLRYHPVCSVMHKWHNKSKMCNTSLVKTASHYECPTTNNLKTSCRGHQHIAHLAALRNLAVIGHTCIDGLREMSWTP